MPERTYRTEMSAQVCILRSFFPLNPLLVNTQRSAKLQSAHFPLSLGISAVAVQISAAAVLIFQHQSQAVNFKLSDSADGDIQERERLHAAAKRQGGNLRLIS